MAMGRHMAGGVRLVNGDPWVPASPGGRSDVSTVIGARCAQILLPGKGKRPTIALITPTMGNVGAKLTGGKAMTERQQSRREILRTAGVLTAVASLGPTIGLAAAQGRAGAGQPHAQIDVVLGRAVEAKEVPGVVAAAATDKGVFYEGRVRYPRSRHGSRYDARHDLPACLDDQGGDLGRGDAAR
jgi:hypothetical protein